MAISDPHAWFKRSVGTWTSQRRYIFDMASMKPTTLTTDFTIAPHHDGEFDYEVSWTGKTNGLMNLKLMGNELHRDIGYFTDEPTVSLLEMIDPDTLVMHTSYDGMTFREEIRYLYNDTVRLRQTTGVRDIDGQPNIVGQYYETRLS